ncbi:DUF4334 domain-containing protein [Pseudomaricurvus sp.]|uniref:DUF4334 domain-containing protein n=1 Tax=Pseudomaricurvus sp. TaxID=2004510 RepID=UPI003F6C4514
MRKLSSNAEAELLGLIEQNASCSQNDLNKLFQQCSPADCDFMLGVWQVGRFEGACMSDAGCYGKRITTVDSVDPILYRKPDGSFYAWDIWGSARLREMRVAGQLQACLLYSDQPWVEAFRRINDDTVLGMLWRNSISVSHFFWMRRILSES